MGKIGEGDIHNCARDLEELTVLKDLNFRQLKIIARKALEFAVLVAPARPEWFEKEVSDE